jgi:hypothetical protein
LKIDFSLEQQGNRQLNDDLGNNLTAIFQIEPNKVINPMELIKQAINKNNITNTQLAVTNNTVIKIAKSETFSNSYTDNHALTFQKINPTFTK